VSRINELENVVRLYEGASRAGRVSALASVVSVRGSTYRRIGAHLLITEDGEVTGSVSGGCLERDVRRHAVWVMQSGTPQHLVYDSTGDPEDDGEDRFSLGCSGVVEVLVERLLPGDAYMAFLAACLRGQQPAVVATVFASSPDDSIAAGSRLLWRPAKEALSPGIRNARHKKILAEAAASAFATGASSAQIFDIGAGRVAACFEIIEKSPALAVFGGGQDAVPLAAMAKALGMKVIIVDPRPGYAARVRFPAADRLVAEEPQAAVDRLALEGDSLAVVMNHDYRQDLAALEALLPTPIRYLGVLGPKRRTARLLTDLAARGRVATGALLARLYSPVGLDIGAETPDEVALAIVAEMKAVLAGRRGGSSRERQGTLHDRADPTRGTSPRLGCDLEITKVAA
jgi:xanthine/CO dehydrogenase XdhC/CoxF family maturation factor